MTTRYFLERGPRGEITLLARIRADDSGVTPEYIVDGQWVEYGPLMDMLIDPSYGEEVSEEKAAEIARLFGGTI